MAIAYPDVAASSTMPNIEMPSELRGAVLNLCKMLCDPTRLRIAYYLTNEAELNVTQLCTRVGQSQPAVSHHLAMLRASSVVDHRRDGRQIFYSLRNDQIRRTLETLFQSFGTDS